MKIFSAAQIRSWDAYTMQHEPIASIDLMERAASRCWQWLQRHGMAERTMVVVCGKGNNGGDGLAIARMAAESGTNVWVFVIDAGQKATPDFTTNWERLLKTGATTLIIGDTGELPELPKHAIFIDALLGTGVSRPVEGLLASVIAWMNQSGLPIVAIDMPSGLPADLPPEGIAVKATYTLTFERPKLSLLMPESEAYGGQVYVLSIGLHPAFENMHDSPYRWIDKNTALACYKPRKPFAHKGILGHAALVVGSYGKMGAAVLAARACMRSGVGLVTCVIPSCGYHILQSTVPEAMVLTTPDTEVMQTLPSLPAKVSALGIGPGIGTHPATLAMLLHALSANALPLVLDADALNLLAEAKQSLQFTTPVILTPHIGEFERLFGASAHHFERVEKARSMARQCGCVIVLKGRHTAVCLSDGYVWFNSTGNAGMATAGSGDVLTGLLTGLLAEGYGTEDAAKLGVYLHGAAGDAAAAALSQEAMLAGDIIAHLGKAYLQLTH